MFITQQNQQPSLEIILDNNAVALYHHLANEKYQCQIPRLGKAKAIFAKQLGFDGVKDMETYSSPGALLEITGSDYAEAIRTQTALDKTSDFLHPFTRLRALGWKVIRALSTFKSIAMSGAER